MKIQKNTYDYQLSVAVANDLVALARRRCIEKNDDIRDNNPEYHKKPIPGFFLMDVKERAFPHFVGLCMEWLYHLISGQPFDRRIFKDKGDKIDFDRVEIKCTAVYDGMNTPEEDRTMLIKIDDYRRIDKRPDYYVFGRVRFPELIVKISGAVSFTTFSSNKYVCRYPGVTDAYTIDNKYLQTKIPVYNNGWVIFNF